MITKELIGKTITGIYVSVEQKDDWLDLAECVLQVDHKISVNFP